MNKMISPDLRQRILDAYDAGGMTRQQVAERFMVSLGMVKKLLQQRRDLGHVEPLYDRVGRHRKITPEDERRLTTLINKEPDLTLEEIRERLGLDCGISTLHRALERLGHSYKKKS